MASDGKTIPIALTLHRWNGLWSVYLALLLYWPESGIRGGQRLAFGFKRIISTPNIRPGTLEDVTVSATTLLCDDSAERLTFRLSDFRCTDEINVNVQLGAAWDRGSGVVV